MLTHPTLEQMQALGLAGMAAAYRQMAEQSTAENLNRDEWLGLMLDRETATRADKRLTNRLATSRLRFPDAYREHRLYRPSWPRPAQHPVTGPGSLAQSPGEPDYYRANRHR